ncbi:MAG: hypothetical protein GX610_10500 [Rhodococcus sp.]|nr:hypothetical protein [Rhodococcus sp. (in: high G+C Gram-positive bacteria)]
MSQKNRGGLSRQNAGTALEVLRENPMIAVITAAPALIVFGIVWWLLGFWPALLLVLVIGGGAFVLKKVI